MKSFNEYISETRYDRDIPKEFISLFKRYKAIDNGTGWFVPFLKQDGLEFFMEFYPIKHRSIMGQERMVIVIGSVVYKEGNRFEEYYYDKGRILGTKVLMPTDDKNVLKVMDDVLKFITTKGSLKMEMLNQVVRMTDKYDID